LRGAVVFELLNVGKKIVISYTNLSQDYTMDEDIMEGMQQ